MVRMLSPRQTVFAVVHQPQVDLQQIITHTSSLAILCDGIQDPGNLGTIIRSADAAGATGVIVSPESVEIYHPKVIRSTMGSIFHLPVVVADLVKVVHEATRHGIRVWKAKPKAAVSIYDASLHQASWFVVGNESKGVSERVEHAIEHSLYIPMAGRAESLNAAMAATVMLFEAMRQKNI